MRNGFYDSGSRRSMCSRSAATDGEACGLKRPPRALEQTMIFTRQFYPWALGGTLVRGNHSFGRCGAPV